jgi:hypothetical protein
MAQTRPQLHAYTVQTASFRPDGRTRVLERSRYFAITEHQERILAARTSAKRPSAFIGLTEAVLSELSPAQRLVRTSVPSPGPSPGWPGDQGWGRNSSAPAPREMATFRERRESIEDQCSNKGPCREDSPER